MVRSSGSRNLLLWGAVATVAVLGVSLVWGITRLRGHEESGAGAATPKPAEGVGGGGDFVDVPPLYIRKEETRYELVDGRRVLGVRLVVDHMPDAYAVKLGDREASIDDDQRLAGGEDRREVFATIDFAEGIERMRKSPGEKLRLPVEVSDKEAADNAGSIAIYLDPQRLGLDVSAGTVASPVRVEAAEDLVGQTGTQKQVIRKRRTTPAPPPYEEPVVQESVKQKTKRSEGGAPPAATVRPREVEPSKKAGKKGDEDDDAEPPSKAGRRIVAAPPAPAPQVKTSQPRCSDIRDMVERARAKAAGKCI
jgi:hypothetical protein